jgi:phosphohistidine phosphatase SixA
MESPERYKKSLRGWADSSASGRIVGTRRIAWCMIESPGTSPDAARGATMIRELILLRHAHAEPGASGDDDRGRGLSPTGEVEADRAGAWLKGQGAAPDRVLCSPALRARATCERTLAALGSKPSIVEEARIYEATPATLLAILDEQPDRACVLLVGHYPGLESLVALLSDGASESGRGMPPAAVAWLDFPAGTLEPGTAEVRHFWWP